MAFILLGVQLFEMVSVNHASSGSDHSSKRRPQKCLQILCQSYCLVAVISRKKNIDLCVR
jgi:hypothetical protein